MKKTLPVAARLTFRPLRSGDEAITFPCIDDELTKYWIGWERAETIEKEHTRLMSIVGRSPSAYFLAFGRNAKFVGMCGLIPELPDCMELGVDVWVSKENQKQGYGLEMVRSIVCWARKNTRKEYLIYSVTEGNTASLKIAEALGLIMLRQFVHTKRGVDKNVTDFKILLR
jgi:RimJ/RimL family protein N-acetyltransferase